MNLSDFSINTLKELVSGDSDLSPYRSGPQLIDLFNRHGARDVYSYKDGGLPGALSRNAYVVERLEGLKGTKDLVELIEELVDPRHFINHEELENDPLAEAINEIIIHDGYRLEKIDGIWTIIGADLPEDVEVEIHFEEIQRLILDQIEIAQFTIWVAVAWFTDRVLFDALVEKKASGVNVQIIVLDDDINRRYGHNYEEHFETYRVPARGRFENIMHHKFCIIDLKTVVHGSYNWTNKARYNNETISIDTSREIAETFANQFKELKS